MLAPSPTQVSDDYVVYDDLPFTEPRLAGQSTTLRCSVYLPANPVAPPPVLIWYHGGAFKVGSHTQRMCRRVGRQMSCQGIAVIAAQYRLRATFDDLSSHVQPQVQDLLDRRQGLIRPGLSQERALAATEDGVALLQWAEAQGDRFGWSEKRIVGGVSAGGILALNLLFTAPALGLTRGPLHGVFASSGGYDFPHLVNEDGDTRIMALHNPKDDRVSIRGVEMLKSRLGAQMELLTSDTMIHGRLELTDTERPRAAFRRLIGFTQDAAVRGQ
ncbi:alpha/beta hydrolase [Roseovarius pacificus]|uniref:alpha/beta hydrolase n=1 Tax=Roseovarius pacificus TaxID=337701 RepID=UPI004039B8D3